jgi:hypothetical protein
MDQEKIAISEIDRKKNKRFATIRKPLLTTYRNGRNIKK